MSEAIPRTATTLAEALAETREWAVKEMVATGKLRFATIEAFAQDGKRTLVAVDMPPPGMERQRMLAVAGLKTGVMQDAGPLAFATFASEIWQMEVQPGEARPAAGVDFATLPNRREALAIEGFDVTTGSGSFTTSPLLRDAAGTLVGVGEPGEPITVVDSLLRTFCRGYALGRTSEARLVLAQAAPHD